MPVNYKDLGVNVAFTKGEQERIDAIKNNPNRKPNQLPKQPPPMKLQECHCEKSEVFLNPEYYLIKVRELFL